MLKRWKLGGLAMLVAVVAAGVGTQVAGARTSDRSQTAAAGCQFANGIKHVVYLQFDNTHYTRDNPSIASDL